jgi:hypothetical protein
MSARKNLVQQMTANPSFFQGYYSLARQLKKAVSKADAPNRK